ncbi:MAG: hypothetical protein JSS89_12300 [Bacteroidetes bacterium]|nr:hypothetical protein [Bacteroidota bacterium]
MKAIELLSPIIQSKIKEEIGEVPLAALVKDYVEPSTELGIFQPSFEIKPIFNQEAFFSDYMKKDETATLEQMTKYLKPNADEVKKYTSYSLQWDEPYAGINFDEIENRHSTEPIANHWSLFGKVAAHEGGHGLFGAFKRNAFVKRPGAVLGDFKVTQEESEPSAVLLENAQLKGSGSVSTAISDIQDNATSAVEKP